MPRSGRGSAGPSRSAPSRPTAAPARPAAPQQSRAASTAAYPSAGQRTPVAAPAQAQSGGSGLFGQMASTAAGVAVGSSIGHAVGGWFGGGSSQAAAPVDQPLAQTDNGAVYNSAYSAPKVCETDITNFRRCMDENQGSISICGWYLDQLKACQSAASQY